MDELGPPHVREAGAGDAVVCIHSNASTSAQWRTLMERLSPTRRVLAPDSLGAGKSPPWPADRVVTLRDEVVLLEPVFTQAGSTMSLVGHSYGGAVALMAALAMPGRVRALTVYEPTLFSLLEAASPGQLAAQGIRDAVTAAGAAVDAGDLASAGACFIDYWMGPGAWAALPVQRQAALAAPMVNVRGWCHALFSEPTPLRAFGALEIPVLCMVGAESPPAARGVTQLLTSVLPNVTVVEFAGLGHMAPVTHAALVNEAIAQFLQRYR